MSDNPTTFQRRAAMNSHLVQSILCDVRDPRNARFQSLNEAECDALEFFAQAHAPENAEVSGG